MLNYIIRKLVRLLITLFVISIIIFSMIHLIPGDPAVIMLGRGANPEAVAALRQALGLDNPFYIQYFSWLKGILRGDMGLSYRLKIPVVEIVLERYPRTLSLVLISSIIALIISLSAGISSAKKQNSWKDLFITTVSLFGISLPGFWLGVLLIMFFSVYLGLLPSSGYVSLSKDFWGWIKHLAMPSFTLGLAVGAIMTRMVRGNLLEVFHQNYITVARSKGLSERQILYKHCLRNALLPVITYFGIQMGYMLGGSVVVEEVFTYPGIGQLVVDAIFRRDYPLVQAVVLAYAFTFIIVNFAVDVSYAILDPRIRKGYKTGQLY